MAYMHLYTDLKLSLLDLLAWLGCVDRLCHTHASQFNQSDCKTRSSKNAMCDFWNWSSNLRHDSAEALRPSNGTPRKSLSKIRGMARLIDKGISQEACPIQAAQENLVHISMGNATETDPRLMG